MVAPAGVVATCPVPQSGGTFDATANAHFIAHAKADIPLLLRVAEAAKIISAESGRQFDPSVVAAFIKVFKEFDAVHHKYKDELEGIHDLNFASAQKK